MSRYAKAHKTPQGPGDARPTAVQIVKDEEAEGKLVGQNIVITGASSGIGIETARALALTGANLFLTARDIPKAKAALADFFDPTCMEIIKMDQNSLDSVRAAGKVILDKTSTRIHLLINNAGIMGIPELRRSADGHELHFGTNYLSHFLFFKVLEPGLLANASSELPSRVVSLASTAHLFYGISDTSDYNFEKTTYDANTAYGQSKTADIYLANEIERRFGSRHLHGTSLHPGIIVTGLTRHMPPDAFKGMDYIYPTMKSVEQGAATTLLAAVGKNLQHQRGKYLVDCDVAEPHLEGEDRLTSRGYAPWAFDLEKASRLWRDSLRLVGLPEED
ncbi:retinol dehydrogenase [Verticillium alfalfae VaMs.102]|uniref:Retinol dehydrogenase n=1 Tax=Verticillium alfalfae (strain VaMs.102 / ATCC MYA-4576 / FGSC 10136) TaxID=526221 RepID=C9SQS9_VERA1|nr:retinol dehydrogenase [Verticillium alfalfae VaMs.102]EEY21204.1 retinol dehydrogenase [Verticillium alfalfae VaMs.102]